MGERRQWRYWWAVAAVLLWATAAQAGTAGMAGVWDFAGTATFYDVTGGRRDHDHIGQFNFRTSSVSFTGLTGAFFGLVWTIPGGGITDNDDGTYTGDLTFEWGVNSIQVPVPWEITDLGNGTATVVTLDGDGDGVPGLPMAGGLFPGSSLAIDGTLTATVPEPVSMALVGGALGLVGLWRRGRPGGPPSIGRDQGDV